MHTLPFTDLAVVTSLKKYHHFTFSATHPGVVMLKEYSNTSEETFTMLDSGSCLLSSCPAVSLSKGNGICTDRYETIVETAQKTSPVPNPQPHSTPQTPQLVPLNRLPRGGSVGSVGKLATPAGPARKTDYTSVVCTHIPWWTYAFAVKNRSTETAGSASCSSLYTIRGSTGTKRHTLLRYQRSLLTFR